jgi:hypothetical protein
VHQAAGGVIDINQRCTNGRAIFKPGMLAPIDLDEFAEACAPQSRLLDFGQTMLARDPQARGDLQLTHGLLGQIYPVLRSELLGSQCRPKICVR